MANATVAASDAHSRFSFMTFPPKIEGGRGWVPSWRGTKISARRRSDESGVPHHLTDIPK